MAQSPSVWQHILSSKSAASPCRNVAAVVVGPPSSGKKVITGCILGHNSASAGATPGAPLCYGHAPLAAASGCEANLEVFAVGSNSQLLSVVLGQGACRSASDVVVVLCLDLTLEAACVQQCQQLVDEVSQCCRASLADADFKPAIVIFACKADLLDVDDKRWDVISASLRLLALNCGAAFAVHSSSSGTASSRQIVLAALQLASWPPPSLLRASFFVPPNHDDAASVRAVLDILGNSAPSLSSSTSKPLDNAPLKAAHPVAADDDQVRARFILRVRTLLQSIELRRARALWAGTNRCCTFNSLLQEFIAAQVPAANVDSAELRKKFGAMVSSAYHSDSSAASGSRTGAALLPSSKAAPAVAARADENVRGLDRFNCRIAVYSFSGRRGLFR